MQSRALVAIVGAFLVGFLLYWVANRIKNAFRRDPNSKRFAGECKLPHSPVGYKRCGEYTP
jgi:membrane protein DedA with SNARE-associated domain